MQEAEKRETKSNTLDNRVRDKRTFEEDKLKYADQLRTTVRMINETNKRHYRILGREKGL